MDPKREPSRRTFLAATGAAAITSIAGCTSGDDSSSDDGSGDEPAFIDYDDDASVSFLEPEDGAAVAGGVYVSMAAENLDIEAVDEGVTDGAGHFHVLVDRDPVDEGDPIPSEDEYVHFGDGSSETVLDLEPGEHTLVLQPGDGQHRALSVTDEVTVEVEEASVAFVGIEDGDTVSSPVEIELEAENLEIEEAGENRQSAGHHHVLVDRDPVDVGEPVPSEDGYNHLGDGSSSIELELEPGEHDLVAQVATGTHLARPVTDEVSITVED